MLVMSKRGRGYPWRKGVLRWGVRDRDLDFFDVEATRLQLNQLGLGDLDPSDVWQQSRGCPLTNYFLPQEDGLRRATEALLAGLQQPERDLLGALCVLRFVREDHLPFVLAAYHGDSAFCDQDKDQSRDDLVRLVELGLVRWSREIDGFVQDPAIRPVLERWLLHAMPELWRRLQCEAYALYTDWQGREPDTARRWIEEAAYHAEQLLRERFELHECFPSWCHEQRYGADQAQVAASTEPNLQAIFHLLRDSFSPAELRRFCHHRPDLRAAYDLMGPNMGHTELIDILIEHCEKRLCFSELFSEIKKENSGQYERYASHLYGTGGLPEGFAVA
jgi:hypothetical protein